MRQDREGIRCRITFTSGSNYADLSAGRGEGARMITVTIYDPHNGHVEFKSQNPLFKKEYGFILTDLPNVYRTMVEITDWANNTHNEAVLFEAE